MPSAGSSAAFVLQRLKKVAMPYPAPYGAILCALFGIDLFLLATGLVFGRPDPAQSGHLPRPLRLSLSAILVAAALLQWRLGAGGPGASYALWIFLGMALGFLGDLVMARLIPVPNRLIYGMLVFGLGHLAYIVALIGLAGALSHSRLQWAVGAIVALAALVLWERCVQKPGGPQALNVAALVYSLLMAAVVALALNLALHQARFIPLALGALLFLTSDLILGHWVIRGHAWPRVNDAIWITYNLGQLLIVSSVAAALSA
jgi:uncharacterized membrane protein YhhN